MLTIKSYTTIEQSRRLAEILPLESADMYYQYVLPKSDKIKHNPEIGNPINALKWYNKGYTTSGKEPIKMEEYCVPCWSLAALFGVLPILDNRSPVIPKTFDGKYRVTYHSTAYEKAILTSDYDNPVDACYEMIVKLY